jgi:hypothetical protein
MEPIFEYQIRVSIQKLKENNFQDFINELLVKKYGLRFTPIKQKRDKGCDGIIEDRTVIAVYAPETPVLREFKKKANDDYDKYKADWCGRYPHWCFIYNGEFTAEMVQCVADLGSNINKWDIHHIMDIIRGLNWAKKRELATYLRVDEKYFINDVLKNVVEDMIRNSGQSIAPVEQKRPVYIEEKIELNFSKEDIQSVLTEYEEALPYLTELKSVLKSYTDEEVASLKNKVIANYGKLAGDFKIKLNNLNDELAERNKNDDVYRYYVRVVLIYFFEACLIGQKTKGEA